MTRTVKDCITAFVTVLCFASMPVFAQAQDDSAQINPAIAQGAVLDLLPEIPMKDGLSPEDYVSGNDHTAVTRRVTVQIGPDGQIMPGADWQKSHPEQCRKQARETNAAAQRLTFEVQRRTESLDGLTRHQYFATVRVIDETSNIVKKKADGTSTVGQITQGGGVMENPDNDGVPDAIGKAMQALGVNFGAPTDGCGDIRLTHQFGSMVDEEFGFVAGYQNASAPNVTYEWNFGGGSGAGSGSQLGRHTYTEKGNYIVTVHVSGEGVRDGSASITVAVNEEEEEAPLPPLAGNMTATFNGKVGGMVPHLGGALTEYGEAQWEAVLDIKTQAPMLDPDPFLDEDQIIYPDDGSTFQLNGSFRYEVCETENRGVCIKWSEEIYWGVGAISADGGDLNIFTRDGEVWLDAKLPVVTTWTEHENETVERVETFVRLWEIGCRSTGEWWSTQLMRGYAGHVRAMETPLVGRWISDAHDEIEFKCSGAWEGTVETTGKYTSSMELEGQVKVRSPLVRD